ncbi:hypothetical protein P5673_011815 [Acropora cervicornis]|uniref:Uncharacterized protein n=1 Tax=Acropora cervicornis TaxID=6130 RepID=A0AAD9QN60_ACRCE|nr:hypothetical protein P5673_011815 [Acropora cervicornis]
METSESDYTGRLYYLEQQPAGKPHELVCSCLYMDAERQELKESTKSKTSQTTLYIDNEFYDQAKTCLNLSEEQRKCSKLSSAAMTKIAHKKWTLDAEGNSGNGEKKYVVPKRRLHKTL